ncbi:MAG: CRTAC1 family protein [Thermoanaerobaculia bacterium]
MKRALLPAAAGLAFALSLSSSPSSISFRDVTKRSGLKLKYDADMRRGKMISTMGGGVAMGDFDGDGHLDLFFAGTVANGNKPMAGPCGVLFRNRGDGTFEDVTARSGIHSCGWMMGASWVDIDSDGRLDLVVTGLGKTEIYKNRGDGTFEEVSEKRGVVAPRFGVGLAAADVNGDGRVDLYVVNYLETTYEKERAAPSFQLRLPDDYPGQEAFLFVQKEDGTFEERTKEAGLTNEGGRGLSAVFFDYDGDGKPDLYVTNDRVANKLYRGNGDGTFEDVSVPMGAGSREQMTPRAGMGIAIGDVDGDGWPDILVTNFSGEPDTLYRNVEGQLFDDATDLSGIRAASMPYVQWGADFVDLDNDGWDDLAVVSGHLVPRWLLFFARIFRHGGLGVWGQGDQSYRQPPLLLRNLGGGRFADVTTGSGDYGKLRLAARGLAVGDLDGDGLPDLVISAVSGGLRLMKNVTNVPENHALEILPVAGSDRRTVLGTKVIVTAGGRRQVKEFILRPSYASGAWVPLHFGLGSAPAAEKVEIVPPGSREVAHVFENVAAGRLYRFWDGHLSTVREFHP